MAIYPFDFKPKKYDFIVGIDPDCEKSGIAILNTHTKEISFNTLTFPALIGEMILFQAQCDFNKESFIVLIEAGWLIKSNWHTNKHQSHSVAASIGNKTGRNHETARKIAEMLRHNDINVEDVKPLVKGWSGPDGKITHDEITYFITPFPKKSNQESRDACLIAWNYAGFGIKIKPSFRK